MIVLTKGQQDVVADAQAAGYQVRLKMEYYLHSEVVEGTPCSSSPKLYMELWKRGPESVRCGECDQWKHFEDERATLVWRRNRFTPSESRVHTPDGLRHRAKTVMRAYKLLGIKDAATRKFAAMAAAAAPPSSDGEGAVPVLPGAHRSDG